MSRKDSLNLQQVDRKQIESSLDNLQCTVAKTISLRCQSEIAIKMKTRIKIY